MTQLRPDDLVGGYVVEGGEKFGRPESPDRLDGARAWFTEATVSVYDKHQGETYAASYQLDSEHSPCRITMTATHAPQAGTVVEGLIEKDGDVVRLVYSLPGHPPPTGFHTGAGQLMFVMRGLNK
jgi:uncharacterized protein (TIGR03067 family)